MSKNYSNYALFGIHNDVERLAYAGWLMLVVVSSFLGDALILVASIKYNAFRLHRTVVVYIQHIAACDLLNAAGNLFPAVVSIIYNSGGSSEILKFASFVANYWVFTACPALISAMTLSKLLIMRCPLRARSWSKKKAHELCAGLWMFSLSVPVLHLLVDKDDVTFDYRVYLYNYQYSSDVWNIIMPIVCVIAYLAPNVIIMISTILFLLLNDARKVVRRTQESLRWQGSMAIVLTAIIYTVSFFPITVYFIAVPLVETDPLVTGPFGNEFYRICEAVLYTNVLANFFVYSLIVASFRDFLKKKFWQISLFFKRSHRGRWHGPSLLFLNNSLLKY